MSKHPSPCSLLQDYFSLTSGYFSFQTQQAQNILPLTLNPMTSLQNYVYLQVCPQCGIQYVGESSRPIRHWLRFHIWFIMTLYCRYQIQPHYFKMHFLLQNDTKCCIAQMMTATFLKIFV